MSEMSVEQLHKAYLATQDELALMRRQYNDLFYNLDLDNMVSTVRDKIQLSVSEGDMHTAISVSADGIRTEVHNVKAGLETTITQTANAIELRAAQTYETQTNASTTKVNLESKITISATNILSTVSATYETQANALATKTNLQSSISQTSTNILSTVSATYETKSNASSTKTSLQSSIDQQANQISMKVSANYTDAIETYSHPPYSDKTRMYYNTRNNKYYFWDGSAWVISSNALNPFSHFKQTAAGFTFYGDVAIEGALFSTGTIKGTTIEGNTITGGTITGTEIKGNTVTGGTITGTTISGGSVSGTKIYGAKIYSKYAFSNDGPYLEIGTDSGGEDLTFSDKKGNSIFAIHQNFGTIDLLLNGKSILYSTGTTTYATGTWVLPK